MSAAHEALAAFAIWFWPQLARHLLEATAFACTAGGIAVSLRRSGAAARHAVWMVAALKFALPVAALAPAGAALARLLPWPAPEVTSGFPDLTALIVVAAGVPKTAGPGHSEALCALTLVWIAGASTLLAAALRQIAGAAPGSLRTPSPAEAAAWKLAALRAGLCRPPELVITGLRATPATWGVLRPRIVLPDGLSSDLAPAELESILVHELAHVRRHDNLVAGAARLIAAVFWFHPLVWWLERRILLERERACDERVLSAGLEAPQYASAILKTCRFSAAGAAAAASAAASTNLRKRMEQIMSSPSSSSSAAVRVVVAALAAAVIAVPLVAGFASGSAALQEIQPRKGREFAGLKVVNPGARPAAHAKAIQALRSLFGLDLPHPARATSPIATLFGKWLDEDVVYIITPEERDRFLALNSDAERERFIQQFWERRDPKGASADNEFKREHYRRIVYANEHFPSGVPGWRTDRGRLYIVLGPADEIESHPGQYEVWTYTNFDGSPDLLVVTFDLR